MSPADGARPAMLMLLGGVMAIGALAYTGCGSGDRTLTVFAAASLADVLPEVIARFEAAHPETLVRLNLDGSQRLRVQLEQGAPADVFISADPAQMDQAQRAGVIGAPPQRFTSNALVLITPASNPAGIRTLQDLAAQRVRLVTAGPDVPAGRLLRAVLETLGVAEAVLASVVSEEESVRAVLTKVALGEADAGFVYRTDARSRGADVQVIALPETDFHNDYLIARTALSKRATLADAFVAFVRSSEVRALFERAGFQPLTVLEAGR